MFSHIIHLETSRPSKIAPRRCNRATRVSLHTFYLGVVSAEIVINIRSLVSAVTHQYFYYFYQLSLIDFVIIDFHISSFLCIMIYGLARHCVLIIQKTKSNICMFFANGTYGTVISCELVLILSTRDVCT